MSLNLNFKFIVYKCISNWFIESVHLHFLLIHVCIINKFGLALEHTTSKGNLLIIGHYILIK